MCSEAYVLIASITQKQKQLQGIDGMIHDVCKDERIQICTCKCQDIMMCAPI